MLLGAKARLSASCSPSLISLFSGWVRGCALHPRRFCLFRQNGCALPPRLPMQPNYPRSVFKSRWNSFRQPKLWFLVTVCYWRFAPTISLYPLSVEFSINLPVNRYRGISIRNDNGRIIFNASIMFSLAPLIINRIGGKRPAAGWHYYVWYVLLAHRLPPQRWKWLFGNAYMFSNVHMVTPIVITQPVAEVRFSNIIQPAHRRRNWR